MASRLTVFVYLCGALGMLYEQESGTCLCFGYGLCVHTVQALVIPF